MTDALIGKQLNNFLIERLLGQGGMAKVYYGTDIGLNRPVAIKVIDERYRNDEPLTARFVSEAQTIATWRHENIIQVYYAGNEDDLYYFVMEYIDGVDLTSYIQQHHDEGKDIPYDRTISILKDVASGLDYAHNKGVIHRDVKPSNIMISSDNRVVLMDFGLALDIQKGTIGESFGTPHYIAPEQAIDASTAVAQSDQYALGVIAFEMLTGKVPFDNPSAMNVAMMHMTEQPPEPSEINPNLTHDIDKTLLKVLSKQPGERFPSCQAFVATLEDSISGRPTLIDDVNIGQVGKILINPRPESNTQTVTRAEKPASQVTTPAPDKPQNRLPLTLIAVLVIVVLVIGAIIALSSSNKGDDSEIPTVNSQLALNVTETPVSPTDQPEDTSIPATETSLPTNTSIPPTTTSLPTDTSEPPTTTSLPTNTSIPPTATSLPTDTSIPPTATSLPTNTPIPAMAMPTLAYPDGKPIVIYYNDSSLYIWNPTSDRIRSSQFKFEALDEDGNTLSNTFDGVRWAQFYSFVDGGNCIAIEMTAGSHLKPPECRDYNSIVNTMETGDIVFWTGQPTIAGFKVLWNDAEIARCETSQSPCTFNIP